MPVTSVAICVEGVLQKTSSSAPIPIGIALYHTLKSNFNILLYSEQQQKPLDYWLSLEALNTHVAVEYHDTKYVWDTDAGRKFNQLSSLRQRGYAIDFVIEPDPSVSSYLVLNGFNTLTFTHAQYAMPQWRPDYPGNRKSWADLEALAIKQAELKALDKRLNDSDEDNNEWR